MLKFASLKYDYGSNLGDEIQSLAAERFLPRVDKKFDRDSLATISDKEPYLLIMNGWFSQFPRQSFPPPDNLIPVFFGFHLRTDPGNLHHFLSPPVIDYFKRHEPIGCRDRHTLELLQQRGVNTFLSRCLTLTFPRREKEPEDGKIFLVDVDGIPLPKEINKNSIRITHIASYLYGDDLKSLMARRLLDIYRDHAKLVITTRLHCALPCLAMGIPVIFFGDPDDSRIALLREVNVPIYGFKRRTRGLYKMHYFRKIAAFLEQGQVNWQPEVPDLEALKADMRQTVTELIRQKMQSL